MMTQTELQLPEVWAAGHVTLRGDRSRETDNNNNNNNNNNNKGRRRKNVSESGSTKWFLVVKGGVSEGVLEAYNGAWIKGAPFCWPPKVTDCSKLVSTRGV